MVDLLRDRSIRVAAVAVLIAATGAVYGSFAVPASTVAAMRDPAATTRPPRGRPGQAAWTGGNGPLVGESFPAVSGIGLDGRAVSTNPDGSPMVVVVWDSRCRCTDVFAAANTVELQDGGAVDLVGVNLDRNLAEAAQTNLDAGLLFPSISDRGGEVVRLTGPVTRGAILVVDSEGKIVADYRDGVGAGDLLEDLTREFR